MFIWFVDWLCYSICNPSSSGRDAKRSKIKNIPHTTLEIRGKNQDLTSDQTLIYDMKFNYMTSYYALQNNIGYLYINFPH